MQRSGAGPRRMRLGDLALGASAPLGALALYHLAVRPWHLAFGATREESQGGLPGDDLLPTPTVVSTRAIDVAAPAEEVWPWLVQLGKDRGGLYSYTAVENLFGLGIHNVDRIVPELQQLSVGDRVPLSKERFAIVVRELDPPRSLVFEFCDGGWVWAFVVRDGPGGSSRLLVRNRWTSAWSGPARKVLFWAMEPSAFVMEERMLRGIKERVECPVS